MQTREIILGILAQESSDNSQAIQLAPTERLEHEWNLWIINGMIDKNYTINELREAMQELKSQGLGPDETYSTLDK